MVRIINFRKGFAEMTRAQILLCTILIIGSLELVGQIKLTKGNLAYLYSKSPELTLHYKVATDSSSWFMYFQIQANRRRYNWNDYELIYETKDSYSTRGFYRQNRIPVDNRVEKENKVAYFKLTLDRQKKEKLFVLTVRNKRNNNRFVFDVPLEFPTSQHSDLLIFKEEEPDFPVFENYLSSEEAFEIRSVTGQKQRLTVYQYNYDFEPALPPMVKRRRGQKERVPRPKTFNIWTDSAYTLNDTSLYVIAGDTNRFDAISFVLRNSRFPNYVTADKLLEPTAYISTPLEQEQIKKQSDTKLALDKFWLGLGRNPKRGRVFVKRFYRSVSQADSLFTSYKDGWKTDKGLVFSIYGPPDEVKKYDDCEIWRYYKTGDRRQAKMIFYPFNSYNATDYRLKRKKNFRNGWFLEVDRWRKGRRQL